MIHKLSDAFKFTDFGELLELFFQHFKENFLDNCSTEKVISKSVLNNRTLKN